MTKAVLNKKISQRVVNGHPWIYGNEINSVDGATNPGDIVEVFTHDHKFIGKGYINEKSQIMIRLLTRDKNEQINEQFFHNRILSAWQYRQKLGYTENCRLIFGEADYMPALIIDKFNDYFVIQTLSYGIEVWKDSIVKSLQSIFQPKGIYERNDVPVRELEGLEQNEKAEVRTFPTGALLGQCQLVGCRGIDGSQIASGDVAL